MKIEIKTGPVQIVSHSYELLDRALLRVQEGVTWLVCTGRPRSLGKQTDVGDYARELLPEAD